jgi:hypothetical protein
MLAFLFGGVLGFTYLDDEFVASVSTAGCVVFHRPIFVTPG